MTMEKNYIERYSEICTRQTEIINKIVEQVNDFKLNIIKQRLEKLNLVHLLEQAPDARFKRITCEKQDNIETYYADNYSAYGIHIVTLRNDVPEFKFDEKECVPLGCESLEDGKCKEDKKP